MIFKAKSCTYQNNTEQTMELQAPTASLEAELLVHKFKAGT